MFKETFTWSESEHSIKMGGAMPYSKTNHAQIIKHQ